jgi:hypothetical protein
MAQDKKSFVLYVDLLKNIEHLTNEEKGVLFNHLLEYVNDLNPILEDRLLLTAWKPIEAQLKRDLKQYEDVKSKRSLAGKKSAELRALKLAEQNKTNSTSVESVQQSSTNPTDNVNGIVNVLNIDSNKEYMSNQKSLSDKSDVDYPGLFKKYIDYYNKAFSKNFTTKGWEKKAYSKFKQAHTSYKENFGKHLVIVCDNIKKDDFHKEKEFKFATPEYILRPEVFERFLNAKPQVQKWNNPSEIYMCADWIKRIPQPPKVNTPEYYRFIEEWKISDLKSYQVNKTGSYTNLDEYGK